MPGAINLQGAGRFCQDVPGTLSNFVGAQQFHLVADALCSQCSPRAMGK
jgi:hypothetical protein